MSLDGQLPPNLRLLRAAAELLANSAGAPVSTRQITQLAILPEDAIAVIGRRKTRHALDPRALRRPMLES